MLEVELENKKYQVTFNPLKSKIKEVLSKGDYHSFLSLHKKADKITDGLLDPLRALHEKYPHSPEVTNLLTYVYLKKKETQLAEKLIKDNYELNPQDLFAKINYADQCLRKKKPKKVPEIFNHSFDLSQHYPQKKLYHYSEMSGFVRMMSFYYYYISQIDKALDFYKVAVQVDPKEKGLSSLEKLLFPKGLFKKLIRSLRPIIKTCKLSVF